VICVYTIWFQIKKKKKRKRKKQNPPPKHLKPYKHLTLVEVLHHFVPLKKLNKLIKKILSAVFEVKTAPKETPQCVDSFSSDCISPNEP